MCNQFLTVSISPARKSRGFFVGPALPLGVARRKYRICRKLYAWKDFFTLSSGDICCNMPILNKRKTFLLELTGKVCIIYASGNLSSGQNTYKQGRYAHGCQIPGLHPHGGYIPLQHRGGAEGVALLWLPLHTRTECPPLYRMGAQCRGCVPGGRL